MSTLQLRPALTGLDLLAEPVAQALRAWPESDAGQAQVAPVDPDFADTAQFCERYGIAPEDSANCVVVAGKRDGQPRYAGCVVLATTRADVNNRVRKLLDVRKASFAPMDVAVELTGMAHGGITPVGLPADWPIFVDSRVAEAAGVVIGGGVRSSKLWLPGPVLARAPGVQVLDIAD